MIGIGTYGNVAPLKRYFRSLLLHCTADLCVRLIGIEAYGGASLIGRALQQQDHQLRRMPVQYVKPLEKANRNDYINAKAIAKALSRPATRWISGRFIEYVNDGS